MARNQQLNAGFTLMEVLVVVAVIALLAAIAIPNYAKARVLARRAECRENRRQIQGAKTAWALEHRKSGPDVPSDSDIFGPTLYLARKPQCPTGGEYGLNAVDELITCSDPDHHATPEDTPTDIPEDTSTATPEDTPTATPQDSPTGTPQGHGKGTPKGKAKGKLSSRDEWWKHQQQWDDLPGEGATNEIALTLNLEVMKRGWHLERRSAGQIAPSGSPAGTHDFGVAGGRRIFAVRAGRVKTTLWGMLAMEMAEPDEAISASVAQGFAEGFAARSLHTGLVEVAGNPGVPSPMMVAAFQSLQVPAPLYDSAGGGEKADQTEWIETLQR